MSDKNIKDVQIATTMTEVHVSTQKRHDPHSPIENDTGSPISSPRMPHERDESFDSQSSEPRQKMQQAYEDIKNGLIDTDRRGMSGVEEVQRDKPNTALKDLPDSSRQPPSTSNQWRKR